MSTKAVATTYTTGLTLYWFPISRSLASWATYRIQAVEASAPNEGRYTATLDTDFCDSSLDASCTFALFVGSSQPTNFDQAIQVVSAISNAAELSALLALTSSVGDDGIQHLAKDLSITAAAATAADSRIVATLKKCTKNSTNDILIDTVTGLIEVYNVTSPTAGDGSVTRDSDSQVTVFVKADAFDHLSPGKYDFDITEISSGGLTTLRYRQKLFLVRSAGRVMAS